MFEVTLSVEQVRALRANRPLAQYAPSQVLFYRNHSSTGLWLLVRGELALREEHRIAAYVVGPSLLGLRELLTGHPYPFTAQAMTSCDLVFLGKEEIGPALQAAPLHDIIAELGHVSA